MYAAAKAKKIQSKCVLCVSDSWQLPNAALNISDIWKSSFSPSGHSHIWLDEILQWSRACLNHQHLAFSSPAENVLFSHVLFLSKGVKILWVSPTWISLSLLPPTAHLVFLMCTKKRIWINFIPFSPHLFLQFGVHLQHCKEKACGIVGKQSRAQHVSLQAFKKHTLQVKSLGWVWFLYKTFIYQIWSKIQ